VRLDALPPSARRVAPCAEGLADRLSERRNCWKHRLDPVGRAAGQPVAVDDNRAIGRRAGRQWQAFAGHDDLTHIVLGRGHRRQRQRDQR
jgi:hypothetical protein